jgi:hypothetical protein
MPSFSLSWVFQNKKVGRCGHPDSDKAARRSRFDSDRFRDLRSGQAFDFAGARSRARFAHDDNSFSGVSLLFPGAHGFGGNITFAGLDI